MSTRISLAIVLAATAVVELSSEAQAWNLCPRYCKPLFGNGNCDTDCNTFWCGYDGGDCDEYAPATTLSPTQWPTRKPTPRPNTPRPTFSFSRSPTGPTSSPITRAPTPNTASPTTRSPTPVTLSPTTQSPTQGTGTVITSAPTLPSGANPGYNIDLRFLTTMTPTVKQAFLDAKARWESIILTDIPSTYTYKKGAQCWQSNTILSSDTIVDDLMIFAEVKPIDGVGKVLGSSGPCVITTNTGEYSRVGLMSFDSADVDTMVNDGSWEHVILHEMGHVIGFGTIWTDFRGLLKYPTGGDSHAYLTGAGSTQGNKDVGGSGMPYVETTGGQGTAYGHWLETYYDTELMTGYLDGDERLSLLTIESLIDLGFSVDKSKADPYTIPSTSGRRLRGDKKKHDLTDDIVHEKPIYDNATPYPKNNHKKNHN